MKVLEKLLVTKDSTEAQYDDLCKSTVVSAISSVLKEDRAKIHTPDTWKHYLDGASSQELILIQDEIRKSVIGGMRGFAIALELHKMLPDSSDTKQKIPDVIWKLLPRFGRSLSRTMDMLGDRAPVDLIDLGKDLSDLHATQGTEFDRVIAKLRAFAQSADPSKHSRH